MRTRAETVEQLATRVEQEALAALAGTIAPWIATTDRPTSVSVVNPLPWRRTVTVAIPRPPSVRGATVATTVDGRPGAGQRDGDPVLVALAVEGFGAAAVELGPQGGVNLELEPDGELGNGALAARAAQPGPRATASPPSQAG